MFDASFDGESKASVRLALERHPSFLRRGGDVTYITLDNTRRTYAE